MAFDWATNIDPLQRLAVLPTLGDNWDGYGAPGFLMPHCRRASTLYLKICHYFLVKRLDGAQIAPFIAPCYGSILFDWAGRRFTHNQLQILVPSAMDSPLEFLKCSDGLEEEGTFRADEVNELLDWLLKKKTNAIISRDLDSTQA